ncbi:amino acid ABC transporter substrate-binding protein (plasmid) [Rhizobium gallicum]|uniref:Amino acid ABC transporter substrate-binding protein n=1 Tax=Rhizobium gallicum TaxID=56730 RepID=A0A1L5NS86_9HYPH|nr:transporter substrate-binding domain-containing protein [Rhizobium gallicum]APO70754.1 amino acid ABC transporter substrate-binding protein [Rhizobium gallicum]
MKATSLFKGLAAAALLFGASLSAHAEDTLASVKAAGTLKVGTETAFAPFDFIDAGEHAGLNVDLFAEIGKELGVSIEWVTLPWEGVLPGLEAGKFDMVAGPATITKARLERYRFTPPIAEATVAILKKAGDTTISKPEDIAGKAIGSGKATAQLAQLSAFSETLPSKVDIREYPAFTESYADLAAGRIVGVANSLPNIAFVASQRKDTFEVVLPAFGQKSYFGFIGPKDADHAALMDVIDAALLKMKADGRLAEMQKKWFGTSFETPDSVKDPAF